MTKEKVDIHLFPSDRDMNDDELSKVKVSIVPELEKLMTRIMRETTLIRITDLKKIGKILEEELDVPMYVIPNRINDIAMENCADYPNIENETLLGKLWAIEQTHKGTELANADLHRIIKRIREDKNIGDEEIPKYFKDTF